MIEVWKPIKGYEGLYDVSNYGRVRKGTTVLKPTKDKLTGYMKINLRKDNKVLHKFQNVITCQYTKMLLV